MTTENSTTQGGIDTATEEEQRTLDEARVAEEAAKAEADAAAKAKDDAARAAAEPPAAPAAAAPVASPAPAAQAFVAPTNIVDEALAKRDFATELADISNKWEEGDIDQATYAKQMQAILRDEAKLEAQRTTQSAFAQTAQASAAQTFESLAEAFVALPDNADLTDPTRRSVFSHLVQQIDTETGGKLPDWDLLQQTRARMLQAFPVPVVATAAAKQPPARGADLAAIPPRLGGLPAAALGTSELDTLASMDITDIEDRMASMTPEAREALLLKLS